MIAELFIAAFKAGLPVALASYALVWWAAKYRYVGTTGSMADIEKEIKALSKSGKKKKTKGEEPGDEHSGSDQQAKKLPKMNPVHNKWISFGGGFYGVVGLLTYAVIEWGEIRDFFTQFDGFAGLINQFHVGLFIEFFINSLMNFIAAIVWPVYWMSYIDSGYIWIWFLAAYGGYWAGSQLALSHVRKAAPDVI